MEVFENLPIRIDIGAGIKRDDGWTTVGLDPEHEIRCDVRSIPVPDEYADEARSIHVIEHIPFTDVPATLKEWFRILKPGGLLIVECPDLLKCCRNVVNKISDERNGLLGLFGDIYGNDPLMLHQFLIDTDRMKKLFTEAGFIKVKDRPTEFHGKRQNRDMRIEGRKPAS
jgi:predicted SAM-dependent methyltransferase